MAITKRNKRSRAKKPVARNANLIRIPKDNTVSLVVWDEKSGRAVRTPLSTEEAGNVAMYLAKMKGMLNKDTKTMIDRDDAVKNEAPHSLEQEVKRLYDMLSQESQRAGNAQQTANILLRNNKSLLDIIENTTLRIPSPGSTIRMDVPAGRGRIASASDIFDHRG